VVPRHLRHLGRAASPIMATTLLIVIAISIGIIVYTVAEGFVGSLGESSADILMLKILAIEAYRGTIVVHLQNLGYCRAVVDTLYVINIEGKVVSIGEPISPNILNPQDIVAIAFDVGNLPDGRYRIKVTGHCSPETASAQSPLLILRLRSALPPIIINEFMIEGNYSGMIELRNIASAPIDLSKLIITVVNNLDTDDLIYEVRILNDTSCVISNEESMTAEVYINLGSKVVPPKSYIYFIPLNYNVFNSQAKTILLSLRTLRGTILDRTLPVNILSGIDLTRNSAQRVSIEPQVWIFATPTPGFQNAVEGEVATT